MNGKENVQIGLVEAREFASQMGFPEDLPLAIHDLSSEK